MTRPEPPFPAPAGFAWVAEADPKWKVGSGGNPRCRFGAGPAGRACGDTPAARMNRGKTIHGQTVPSWWAYCREHMANYQRWIDGDQVKVWQLQEVNAGE